MTEQEYRERKLAEIERGRTGYVFPAAGRAALLNAAADAHRMALIGATPRHHVPDEDLAWYLAEPQRRLASDLYSAPVGSLSNQLNAVGRWLRALAGGDP